MNLGKIVKVPLREIWKHEALDFTKWLVQEHNLAQLSEEIGLEIQNAQTEVGVGKFAVDIFAEDESGRRLIIENQLESTNHDHLGKIITYAAGLQAETIIWVVPRVREEHEQAINWLNENTTEDANFFLVRIEAWQIGDSLPAPKFTIIAKPNDWAKAVRQSRTGNNVSDLKLKQQAFWDKLREYGEENSRYVKSWQKALPQAWMNITIGTSRAHLAACLNKNKQKNVAMELYITDDKELFYKLHENRPVIEEALGYELIWQELPKKKAARIVVIKDGDFTDDVNEQELIKWLHARAEDFTRVLKTYL